MTNKVNFRKSVENYIFNLILEKGFDIRREIGKGNEEHFIIKKPNGGILKIRLHAISNLKRKNLGDYGLFAAIKHEEQDNFYFIFYLEYFDEILIMLSRDFVKLATKNKTGSDIGKYNLNTVGSKNGEPFIRSDFIKYIDKDKVFEILNK